jgi:hypothetical protein
VIGVDHNNKIGEELEHKTERKTAVNSNKTVTVMGKNLKEKRENITTRNGTKIF